MDDPRCGNCDNCQQVGEHLICEVYRQYPVLCDPPYDDACELWEEAENHVV
jgi:hypothetical protein